MSNGFLFWVMALVQINSRTFPPILDHYKKMLTMRIMGVDVGHGFGSDQSVWCGLDLYRELHLRRPLHVCHHRPPRFHQTAEARLYRLHVVVRITKCKLIYIQLCLLAYIYLHWHACIHIVAWWTTTTTTSRWVPQERTRASNPTDEHELLRMGHRDCNAHGGGIGWKHSRGRDGVHTDSVRDAPHATSYCLCAGCVC